MCKIHICFISTYILYVWINSRCLLTTGDHHQVWEEAQRVGRGCSHLLGELQPLQAGYLLSLFFIIISQSRHSYTGLINHHCHWDWQQTHATDLQKLLDFLRKSTMQRPMPTWHGANHPFSMSLRADDTAGTQNQQRAGKWNLHPHPTADLEMQIKMGIPRPGVSASSLLLLAFISERGRKVHHLVALAQPKQHTTAG